MRQLHVLGLSDDGRQLLLSSDPEASRAGYAVAVDARLDRIIRSEPVRGSAEPTLAVKDIQAALRAGATPEEVATQVGVAVSRIERYAGPVISERERILDQALASYSMRSRLGRSILALGDAVSRSLGRSPEADDWTVARGVDGVWVLRLAVSGPHRRKGRLAAWSYDPATRELTPLDATAATLGHLERGRPAGAPPRKRAATGAAPKSAQKSARKSARKSAQTPTKKTATKTAARPAARSTAVTGVKSPKRGVVKPAKPTAATSAARPARKVVPPARTAARTSTARATPARPARPR